MPAPDAPLLVAPENRWAEGLHDAVRAGGARPVRPSELAGTDPAGGPVEALLW